MEQIVDKGVGDILASAIRMTGITKVFPSLETCTPCEERKKALNNLFKKENNGNTETSNGESATSNQK